MRRAILAATVVVLGGACSTGSMGSAPSAGGAGTSGDLATGDTATILGGDSAEIVSSEGTVLPPPPATSTGPTAPELLADLDEMFGALEAGLLGPDHVQAVGSHGDLRVGWVLADLARFAPTGESFDSVILAFEELTGVDLTSLDGGAAWKSLNDHLIAWDVPAFDEYVDYKERLFVRVEPGWAPFFADTRSRIDWRLVTWGGVLIDDRELGSTSGCPRGCIPALDDPSTTPARDGGWYPEDAIVFGVVVGGEARAYPKNVLEVHEMVNDTIGGRRVAIPYCTLCGSAQLYFTDAVPDGIEIPVLRTSGLLARSNKVMYDLRTGSVFDTFTGEALSGPLREAGLVLEQGTVVASSWAEWRESHPDTRIVAEDGGIGRSYPLDPLQGRDDDGPVFPVGDVDSRLGVQDLVVGVIAPDGTPVAFPVASARAAIREGRPVEARGVMLTLDGDGLRAAADGGQIPAHQAFWFAWSQFHPSTEIWRPA